MAVPECRLARARRKKGRQYRNGVVLALVLLALVLMLASCGTGQRGVVRATACETAKNGVADTMKVPCALRPVLKITGFGRMVCTCIGFVMLSLFLCRILIVDSAEFELGYVTA